MSLALRLGRSLNELRQSLTANELKMWIEFDRISPIGDWRGDIHAAQIATAAINAQGGKATLDEMILKWGQQDPDEEISDLETWMSNI